MFRRVLQSDNLWGVDFIPCCDASSLYIFVISTIFVNKSFFLVFNKIIVCGYLGFGEDEAFSCSALGPLDWGITDTISYRNFDVFLYQTYLRLLFQENVSKR